MGDVVITSGAKLGWIERVTRDHRTKPFDVCVIVAISSRLNKDGVARVSQQALARFIGATERGVRKSIERLAGHGLLEVVRSEHGAGKDGREAFGGRDGVTSYRPVLHSREQETRNGGSGFNSYHDTETRNERTRNGEAGNPERRSTKPGTAVPPSSLESSNRDFLAPVHAHACAREADDPGGSDWQAIKGRVADRHGQTIVDAWLGSVVAIMSDDVLTIAAPTKFARGEITTRLGDDIAAAARAVNPTITAVKVVVADGAPAPGVSRQVGDTRDDTVSERERDWRAKRSAGGGFGRLALELARQAREEGGE